MLIYRRSALLVTALAAFSLVGCAVTPDLGTGPATDPSVEAEQQTDARDEFPFPVPEGWAELEPFTEEKLGKDITMSGGFEYPGDTKTAAAHYQQLLTAAGFDAYPYAPGELTNQASIAAEGVVAGEMRIAILNFDVFADGYQRVVITVALR